MARSYIKIYGPPILKAIRALEKIAVEMSERTTIRFYNVFIPPTPYPIDPDAMEPYFGGVLADVEIPAQEKVKLISRSSDMLGEFDFFFEWGAEPTKEQVLELVGKIDEALAECRCTYTITTK